MAASDQKKGPSASALIKKAGGAVKKIFRGEEQWEHLDYDKELKVILSIKGSLSNSFSYAWVVKCVQYTNISVLQSDR